MLKHRCTGVSLNWHCWGWVLLCSGYLSKKPHNFLSYVHGGILAGLCSLLFSLGDLL